MGLDQFQGTQKERLLVVHTTFNYNNLNLALFIQFMLVIYNYPTTCNIHNARNTHLVLLCKIGRRFSAPFIPNHCFPIQRKAERKNHENEMVATHWANTEKRSGNICIWNEMFVAIKMANLIIIFIECDQKHFCVWSLGVKTYWIWRISSCIFVVIVFIFSSFCVPVSFSPTFDLQLNNVYVEWAFGLLLSFWLQFYLVRMRPTNDRAVSTATKIKNKVFSLYDCITTKAFKP